MSFYRIPLKSKVTVFLTADEIQSLLLKDIDLYKIALRRGKSIMRSDSKFRQYEEKLAQTESAAIDQFLN